MGFRFKATLRSIGLALALAAAAGSAIGTVLGFGGGAFWALDLFAHFRLQYAAVLLAAAACLLAFRRPLLAAACLPFLALNLALLVPLYLGEPAAKAGGPKLHVIAFNVNASNEETEPLARWLAGQEADVVILTELRPEVLKAAHLALPDYETIAHPRMDSFGIGVLSRVPILESEILHLGGATLPAVALTVEKQGERFAVLGLHPPPPMSDEMTRRRDAILAEAAEWARARRAHVVVAGDLNTTPWGRSFGVLLDRGALHSSQRGFGFQASWPSGFWALSIPIDHCLHGESLSTLSRQVGPALGSDHRPVTVVLGVTERRGSTPGSESSDR